MTVLYYIPPTNEIFEEVRTKAIDLWKAIDSDNDKYGYATSKISQIKDIGNVSDNLMYIVAMFDSGNQVKLIEKLSEEAKEAIEARLNEN
ncbi:MAG: hypothetical protein UT24_C0034G0022 [Candidatus Woesebacteria bacterium GW2011_GWB1_39_12]|uniref:Uncharacterized protein n=1 Tax=Candidatus Woesebacteria bacterium GW2011_GWB1_39_12 TaxID=1618574 RepID=A0A0G0PL38_9BACT|nr:MAG: hypothetical protein UT24_C0034G0022 [Candidatus Woesebacteria bacterium GW2011_GWB1_39_12]